MLKQFHRWREKRRFNKAKEKAIYMNQLSGQKHIVLKLSGQYYIINRTEALALKKRGLFKKGVHWQDIERKALYIANDRTSNRNR